MTPLIIYVAPSAFELVSFEEPCQVMNRKFAFEKAIIELRNQTVSMTHLC